MCANSSADSRERSPPAILKPAKARRKRASPERKQVLIEEEDGSVTDTEGNAPSFQQSQKQCPNAKSGSSEAAASRQDSQKQRPKAKPGSTSEATANRGNSVKKAKASKARQPPAAEHAMPRASASTSSPKASNGGQRNRANGRGSSSPGTSDSTTQGSERDNRPVQPVGLPNRPIFKNTIHQTAQGTEARRVISIHNCPVGSMIFD